MPPEISIDDLPDDIDELTKMADAGEIPDEGETGEKQEGIEGLDAEETPPAEAGAKPESGDTQDKPEETKAEETKPVKGEGEAAKEDEPTGDVLTRDGQHTIPYQVLADTREEARRAKTELEELRAQLRVQNQLQAQQPQQPAPQQPAAPPPDEIPADVQAKIDKAKEDWGQEIADIMEQNFKMSRQIAGLQQSLVSTHDAAVAMQQNQQTQEEREIQRAIDDSESMLAWQTAKEPLWYDQAVNMHRFLLENNPKYAQMSWHDRFQVLPEKVKAMYPDAPLVEKTPVASKGPEKVATQTQESIAAAAEQKVAEAQGKETVPTSHSDLTGGAGAEASEIEKIERMSPEQLQAHMDKLADDPEKLSRYLAELS